VQYRAAPQEAKLRDRRAFSFQHNAGL